MARNYKKNRVSWLKKGATLEEKEEAQYQAYLRAYYRQAKKVGGEEYMSEAPLPKEDYLTEREATKNDLIREIKRKERKSIGNINQYIVRDQAYPISYKQVKALQGYIEREYGAELQEWDYASQKAIERGEIKLSPKALMSLRKGELQEELGIYEDISTLYHDEKEAYIKEQEKNIKHYKKTNPELYKQLLNEIKKKAMYEAQEIVSATFFYKNSKEALKK